MSAWRYGYLRRAITGVICAADNVQITAQHFQQLQAQSPLDTDRGRSSQCVWANSSINATIYANNIVKL